MPETISTAQTTIENPTNTGFSKGLNSMAEGLEKALAAGQRSQAITPVESPVKPATQPRADNSPENTSHGREDKAPSDDTEQAPSLKVPEFKGRGIPLKNEEWTKAKQAAIAQGRKEAEAELRQKMIDRAEYESIAKERDELRTRLQTVALDQDPVFQREIKMKQGASITLAKEAVGPDLAPQVEMILRMPASSYKDEALDKLFENLTPAKSARLSGAIAAFEQVEQERQARLAQAPQEIQGRIAQQQAYQKQQQTLQTQAFEDALAMVSDPETGVELMTEKPGDDAHNKTVAHVRAMAKHIYSDATTEEVARAAIQAAMYVPLLQSSMAQAKRIEQLESELNTLRGSKPSLTGDTGGSSSNGNTPLPKPGEGLAAMMEGLKKRGLVRDV